MIEIITDSTCDIPEALVQQYHIQIVSHLVLWGEDQFRDRVDIQPIAFYERLVTDKRRPTTSQASVADFQQAYAAAIARGADEIVVLTVSSAMLQKYHPLWMNIHVNHPNEISQELADAADKLTRAGIPLGNQSVLLAGVNDCVHIQRDLVQKLVRIRVRPYYLYQCDLVEGAGHFRTPVAKGIEIIEGLRGHTSGFAVPTYVVDAPGGGGKIPLMPSYQISASDHKIILRNYEGYITTYEEPQDYKAHDPATCKYCQSKRM